MQGTVSQCPTYGWCVMGGDNIHRIHRKTEYTWWLDEHSTVNVYVVAEMDGPIEVDIDAPPRLPLEVVHGVGLALCRIWTSYNDAPGPSVDTERRQDERRG